MRLGFRTFFLLVAAVLCFGEIALAWGPATHIGLAGSVLEQLAVLPAAIAAILARNSVAYLYGNIAADIVFAKRWSRVKQFCHHWSTGFRLLEHAQDERAASFAYGYLSHLAADTIAHGKYVPRQIVVSDSSVNFGHFYWELRADAVQPQTSWSTLKQIIADDHGHHHQDMEPHLTDTFLSYDLNRLLFHRMNALTIRKAFRGTMSVCSRLSKWELPASLMTGYHNECVDRIQSILAEGRRSPVTREDPNGTSALMKLSVRRREVRRNQRVGIPVSRRIREASAGLAPRRPMGAPRNSIPPVLAESVSSV